MAICTKRRSTLDTDGRQVHCLATWGEAVEYRHLHCPSGTVLGIDADGLMVGIGSEYPHPVVADRIPAAAIVAEWPGAAEG